MYEFLEYRVRDAMTFRPVTVTPKSTLALVEAVFDEHDYDTLPVCDGQDRLLGVVSKLDFLRAFSFTRETMIPRYRDLMQRPAESVMTTAPITVTEDTPLTRVLQQMVTTRHKSFPVVRDGVLLGMVSRRDVLRAVRRAAAGELARSAGLDE